jgi:prolipoprotein diacylglyceryltransferase
LWQIRHKIKVPGVLFGVYLILNGLERFTIELIRVNTRYHVAGVPFTQAELISLILVLGGVGLIVNGSRGDKKLQGAG